ncbi:Stk1 family PASTA domain-containing Ser/Thr kinase [Nocardioides pacificus]
MTNQGSTPGPKLVGGRYELAELLGRGGMAEVRKGTDLRLGRTVAVKRLRTDLASDSTFQARFRREAQSSASLNHPAIVSVYDTGEEWSEPDGHGHAGVAQPYIVMEYVAGRTLREILREGRKILPERALEITSGVLSALDYSHRAGIIHRDIKPGNVMLTPSGDIKVMDFGIARAVSDASSAMTQTAAVVGTAQYLSPEQARGETVDSRSDVYSTGCLLYELLTGRPPFMGDSPVAVAYQHVREPATPPSHHDTDLPPEIDAIVMKSLAKRVEDRYQSAAAMRSDIERYLAGRPVQAPAVAADPTDQFPAASTGQHPTSVAAATPYRPEEEKQRGGRAWLIALAALLLLVLGGVAAYLVAQSAPERIQVPDLSTMTEEEARAAIGDVGLTVGGIDEESSDDVPSGQVIDQDPTAGSFVDADSAVSFTVSLGKPQVEVPFVLGQDRIAARDTLREAGLGVKMVEREDDEDRGEVLETQPAPGTAVAEGTVVTVFYSDGPEEVPNVVGMDVKKATELIEAADFVVKVIESDDTEEKKGTVLEQNPLGSETAANGATVFLVVSSFVPEEKPSETPSPTETPSETPPGPPTDLPTP